MDELSGIEIGGSAANPFGLRTQNVDNVNHLRERSSYAREQLRVCGRVLSVDVIASGQTLPFDTRGQDFVLASNVIEHFHDSVAALIEWVRVANRYV